jgi:hypothetical protein
MLMTTAEELAKFVAELRRESDRGLALVGASFIDSKLRDTVLASFYDRAAGKKMLDGGGAPLGTFSSRAQAALALGLIERDEYVQITLIRKIRNEFAHEIHGISFNSPRIQGLCSTLKDAEEPTATSRLRFTHAVLGLILRLYHRPDWAAKTPANLLKWHQLSPLQINNAESGSRPTANRSVV